MTTYASSFGSVCIIEQPVEKTLKYNSSLKTFASTSDGHADSNTVISTELTAVFSGDSDLAGQWIECIYATNSQNQGLRRRILAWSSGSDTVTCDRFPAQVKSGDTFYLLNPPQPVWCEDTGSAATGVADATRTEVDDFWNGTVQEGGPYLEAVLADNVSSATTYLISDFAQSTGTASATLGANTVENDYFEAWQHIEKFSGMMEGTREEIARENPTGTFFAPKPIHGSRSCSGNFELAFRGPGRGREGSHAEIHRILKCVLDATDGTNLTVNTPNTTASVAYDVGTAVDGMMYCTANGEVFISTSSSTPLVPDPVLDVAPLENSTIYGLTTYQPSTDINYHLAVKQFTSDGILDYFWGCAPNVTFSGDLNSVTKINVALQGSDWARLTQSSSGAISRAWTSTRSSVAPLRTGAMRVKVGSTSYYLKSFSYDIGAQFAKQINLSNPNESDGFALIGYQPKGTMVAMLSSANRASIDDWLNGREQTNLIQVGGRCGYPGVLGIYSYRTSYTNAKVSDDGGMLAVTLEFSVNYTSATDRKAFAIGIG